MKKFFAAVLTMAIAITCFGVLTSCGGSQNSGDPKDSGETGKKTYEIAVVTDVGQLKDGGFNQGTYEGAEAFAIANDKTYKYYQPANGSNATDNDRVRAMEQAIQNGAKVIVAPGFLQADAMRQVATDYPDIKFVFVDGWAMGLNNVTAISYKEQESGYFAGYAAVKEGYTKLGGTFGGGGSNPACNRFAYGYVQGARAAAAELETEVEVKISYKEGDSFSASPALKSQMAGWYATGTEIIFACGGSMVNSVKSAAEETTNGKIIGVDTDQSGLSNRVVTSAVKGLSASVQLVLEELYNGEWDAKLADKASNLGAAENATGLPTAEGSWRFENFTLDEYNALFAKVKDGTVVPDANVLADCNDADFWTALSMENVITVSLEK